MIYLILIFVVWLGGFLAFTFEEQSRSYVKLLLSFSGAYLLSILVFHLLPDVYGSLNGKQAGLFIMLGIVFQLILELFSKGAEHGHQHEFKVQSFWLVFLSLSMHAFLEGLPINHGAHFHASYFYGILIHKLPIAVVLTTLMIQSGLNKKMIYLFLLLFSLMSPLAAFVGKHLGIILEYDAYINAFVVGILAHIGTTILFENEHSHQFKIRKFLLIFIAMGLAYFS